MKNLSKLERISKVIARSSQYSRRQVEELILEGRVQIDGKKIDKPNINVGSKNKIYLDNELIKYKNLDEVYIFNKPRGCLVTHSDPEKRKTIFDLLPKKFEKLISIGRLDFNSEGLLILTNNGDLKRHYELPKNNYERTYRVRVQGKIDERIIRKLKKGVFANNVKYKPIIGKIDSSSATYSWLTMTLKEGKNREIRNIFESFNMTVTRLIRVSYGPYKLGKVGKGEFIKIKVINN
jgi:23S rRNA pseudouridine2605 synthase